MPGKPGLRLGAIAICLLASACSFNVVAPPARLAFAESPKVTAAGKTRVSVDGMGGGKAFGPEIQAATLRVSKGFPENREVNLRPVVGMVNKDHRLKQSNVFYGLALDVKTQVNPTDQWWAASLWGGGGYLYSSFGHIYSGQGGFAIGKESSWFRPFFSSDIFFDIPANTRPIRSEIGESESVKRLTPTMGAKVALGLKLQFIPKLALVSAGSLGIAHSETDEIPFILLGQSIEYEF